MFSIVSVRLFRGSGGRPYPSSSMGPALPPPQGQASVLAHPVPALPTPWPRSFWRAGGVDTLLPCPRSSIRSPLVIHQPRSGMGPPALLLPSFPLAKVRLGPTTHPHPPLSPLPGRPRRRRTRGRTHQEEGPTPVYLAMLMWDLLFLSWFQRPSPDIKPTLYELLHQILHNNWRYFFKGSVLSMMKGHADEVENEGQFTSIMQSFGQSFLQPDISIFKQNLETLESLNSKWKLYHKVSEVWN